MCGDLFKSTTYNGETLIARKTDNGWRAWITGAPGTIYVIGHTNTRTDDTYSTEYGQLKKEDTSTDSQWANISYAVIDGAKANPDHSFELVSDKTTLIIQFSVNRYSDKTMVYPVLYANGGTFTDGEIVKTPWTTQNSLAEWTEKNTPTRSDGYVFKEWSTDQAGQHPVDPTTITLKNGTRLYAQWEKAAGDPQKVDLDCSTGGRCELTVNYSGSTAKTREFQPGSGALTWSGSPVTGVRLDASGYAADGACSDTRCWYVSLDKESTQQGSYQAQMPTTGAPEGLSSAGLIALIVSILGVALTVLRQRS